MSFTVTLYNFSKKVNSTARPSGASEVDSYNCILKDSSGIINPSITLDLGLAQDPSTSNYAYIPTFNRYYFVREWVFENRLWTAHLYVDALASWKGQIGDSICYVLRSSIEYDTNILDSTYPATSETLLHQTQIDSPWVTSIESGVFVVGIAGQSTTYYIFNKSGLDAFFTYLFSNDYADALLDGSWTDIFPSLKAQSNPLQYITSIMWMPFVTEGTLVPSVRVGWVDVPIGAYQITGVSIRADDNNFTIMRHPQEARGDYLNNAPYSTYTLFYPPWGTIPLDPDIMANSDSIKVSWIIDLRTGQGTLIVSCASNVIKIMSVIHAQVGLNYQVSQVVNRGFGFGDIMAPLLSVGANAISGNYIGAGADAIKGVANGIGDYAASKIPSATTIGSNGGLNSLIGSPSLQYEFKYIVDEDISHRGKPLCKMKQINTLSGYMKVANAYINSSATQTEKETIISYMEGGFYYE